MLAGAAGNGRGSAGIRGSLRIGALETLADVSLHPAVRRHCAGLAEAAGLVAGPQLRNMGTIGGNVCLDTRCTYYNQTEFWRDALGYCLKKDGHGLPRHEGRQEVRGRAFGGHPRPT